MGAKYDTGPEFRALLRALRDRRRWSQERLAQVAGMDCSLVSRLEGGLRQATPDAIGKLIVALEPDPLDVARLYLAGGFAPPALAALEAADLAGLLRVVGSPQRRRLLTLLGGLPDVRLGALLTLLAGDTADVDQDERRLPEPRLLPARRAG
jgi:transcriptional regulator with XRE-family HTH domain